MNPLYLETAVILLGLGLILAEAFAENVAKRTFAWVAIGGLVAVLVLTFCVDLAAAPEPGDNWRRFYATDGAAMFFKRFALVTTILVLLMALDYLPVVQRYIAGSRPGAGLGEFLTLPVFTCAGLMWMASAKDLTMIFVSLELVTVSFYVLVAYMRRNSASLEAGVKYLILGALSTGFLVYGLVWTYGLSGHTALDQIGPALAALPPESGGAIFFAFVLVLVGLGFKIAAAPFQLWVPDVYQGAPTPITAFLSVGSKAAGFIVLMRVLDVFLSVPSVVPKASLVLVGVTVATLVYGNLAALPQTNLKRLLAYSSIAHAGYLLVAVTSVLPSAGGTQPPIPMGATVAFYLGGYLLMTILAFAVMVAAGNHLPGDEIIHFNGLAKRSPALAFGLLVGMASLAGVPFTVGFFGKFFVFAGAVARGQWLLVAVGTVAVACGFYYYLKVVRAMYFQPPVPGQESAIPLSGPTRVVVVALAALILFLGVYPQPALNLFPGAR